VTTSTRKRGADGACGLGRCAAGGEREARRRRPGDRIRSGIRPGPGRRSTTMTCVVCASDDVPDRRDRADRHDADAAAGRADIVRQGRQSVQIRDWRVESEWEAGFKPSARRWSTTTCTG
jgi:hypothetical protein